MNINLKELCKQIKKSNNMIWALIDGVHYITNRHWAVKYESLPREILIELFAVFAEIPEAGAAIQMRRGWEVSRANVDIKKVFDDLSAVVQKQGEVTPYLKLSDKDSMRVIKIGDEPIYVNNDYMKIIKDVVISNPTSAGKYQPIAFNENTLILLPYRMTNSKDDETIAELLAS